MSKKGDLQSETKQLIRKLREVIEALDGEKTTIRFLLYKLIGMRDSFGEHMTKITSTKDYAVLKNAINDARIRQSKQDEKDRNSDISFPTEVWGLPDDPFVDNKREVRHNSGYANAKAFVDTVKNLYARDIWQDQPYFPILLVEKATVGDVLESVARKYQVQLCVSMGYFGRTFMLDIAERIIKALNTGSEVRIGYVGDHDPSGMDMEESLRWGNDKDGSQCAVGLQQLMVRTNGCSYMDQCTWKRIAVTTEDFEAMEDGLKVDIKELEQGGTKGDSRSPKYKEKYGNKGAEVEALDSQTLRDRVEEWITAYFDQDAYAESLTLEETEREQLAALNF
jgi:hypothetical protein